jgi:hypothetical protein
MSLIKQPYEIKASNLTLKILIYGQPGIGKQQPISCKILTETGFKKLGDISVGESVFGANGQLQEVTAILPQGEKPVYKITFNDGTHTFCGPEHLWTVRRSSGNSRKAGWQTLTMGELIEKGLISTSASREESGRKPAYVWEIPIMAPAEFTEKTFDVHPYILGVLIGDGSLVGSTAVFSNPDLDSEIQARVNFLLPENYTLHEDVSSACPRYRISRKDSTTNGYIQKLISLGLDVSSGNKFIPKEYFLGSHEQRLDLLRGLMDTDGSAKENRVSFSTTSSQLAEDITHLIRSLGGIGKIHTYDRTAEGKSIEYRVNVKMRECPFYLKRKAHEWREYTVSRYIAKAERVENQECLCIMVSNEDGLYITDNYIVTHNSTLALSMPKPVLIDADNGVHRIAPQHRVPTLQVSSFEEVLQVLESHELAPFKTIVIDTAGKLLDYINAHIVKMDPKNGNRTGNLSQQGWGVRARVFGDMVRSISTLGKHLVFVAHDREEKDGEYKIIRPDFGGGKAGNELMKELDIVGYMEAIGKNRTISFTPCEKYYAKNSARIDDVLTIPLIMSGSTNNTALADIVAQCEAAMSEESVQVKEYKELIDSFEKDIARIKDVKGANAAIKALSKASHIWDSKTRLWETLKEKAKDIGLKYENKNKAFVVSVEEKEPVEEEVA